MTLSPDDDGRASRTPAVLASASIVTPGDWIELDLNPATRHGSISHTVRQAVLHSPSLASSAIKLIALLDRTSKRAVDAGAFYCASHVIEGANGDVMVRTVLLQLSPLPSVPCPPGTSTLSITERCAELAEVMSNDPPWAGADVDVVLLAFVGPAVRLHAEDNGVIVQYIVPLEDETACVVLTFACPCPPYTRFTTQLFDAMAQSLHLHYA